MTRLLLAAIALLAACRWLRGARIDSQKPSIAGSGSIRHLRRRLAARSVRRSRSWGTPEHLEFLADRLVHVYGENPNVDYIRRAREFAADARIPYRDTWTPQPDHSGCGDAFREMDWLPSTLRDFDSWDRIERKAGG